MPEEVETNDGTGTNWMERETPENREALKRLMRKLRTREPVHVDPEDYELLLRMQAKVEQIEDQMDRFVERHDIIQIAKDEARKALRDLGFDMEHQPETASKVIWLLGLKPGVKGAVYAFLAAVMTALVGLGVSWLQSLRPH